MPPFVLGATAAQLQSFIATAVLILSSAGALYRGLTKALRKEIADQVLPVATALSLHMDNELADLQSVRRELKANRRRARKADRQVDEMKATLDDRTPLLDKLDETMQRTQAVLEEHMEHDTAIERQRLETRERDGQLLVQGQRDLKAIIEAQHAEAMRSHNELAGSVDEHVKADSEAFARIETQLSSKGQP